MALVWMDGKEISVAAGETLLQAALRSGTYIPYFCYHPSLSIVGQCRMCLVGVEGAPKLLTACTTYVPELPPDKKLDGRYDMKVSTASAEVKDAQRGILEFLLLNHPLDCPICDQAGECQLQNYSYDYGNPRSDFRFEKLAAPKRVDMGPHIIYDAERCIKCTRCVRFCNEVTGTGELTLAERGALTLVETFEGRRLDNPYSVCTADICPVGALTFKEFRFKERVWFLQAANSVCCECGRNCSVRVDSYKGEILRLVPRSNPGVNGSFMCDHGRLVVERIKGKELRELPGMRIEGRTRSMPEDRFYRSLLARMARNYTPSEVLVVLSGRMTLEEMQAYKVFSLAVFGQAAGEVLYVTGDKDRILISEEKRPNYAGARLLGLTVAGAGTDIVSALKGKKAAVIIREDILGTAGEASGRLKQALEGLETLVVMDSFFTGTAALAGYYIPLAGWFEMEGTTVNVDGHLQKITRCVSPPSTRRPFYDVVSRALSVLMSMAPSDFESKKDKELENLNKVLQEFKDREVISGGFAAWFKDTRNAVQEMKGVSVKDIVPLGLRLTGKKDGNG